MSLGGADSNGDGLRKFAEMVKSGENSGVTLSVSGMTGGDWRVEPYDTWTGEWLEPYPVVCSDDPCEVSLPGFSPDLALHLTR